MDKIGQYIPGETIIHRLDPRVKIVAVFLVSLLVFRANVIEAMAISVFLFIVCTLSALTWFRITNVLRPLSIFLVLVFLAHALFPDTPDSPAGLIPRVDITAAGLYRGIFVSWQFITLVIGAAVLTMTTPPEEMLHAIEKLLGPFRFVGLPVHDAAMMLSVALRLMPMLLEELERITEAQAARGAEIRTGPLTGRLKAAAALPVPLVISAFRRADELADAMEARGYQSAPRTTLRELRITQRDVMALVSLVGLVVAVGILGTLDPESLRATAQAITGGRR